MKIVHTCLRYPPATGGAEAYVEQIVRRTQATGQDARVLTSKLRTHGPAEELPADQLLDDPPYVQRIHHSRIPFLSYPRLQALNYYMSRHKPELIHGYSFWYQPADVAARVAKKLNVPFIFHPIYYENDVRRKLQWRIYKSTIGRRTFQAADVVAVISPFEQQLIEKAGLPVKRFELLPPGIDPEEFTHQYSNPFPGLNIKAQNILVTASRLAPGKGLEDTITALPSIVKQHPDTALVIVGEDFGLQKELQGQAASQGVQQHVHFPGKLTREQLIGALQHATLFLHPSHYEAFGIIIAEALAAGAPVVARNATAIPFVAPHNQAALLFNSQQELTSHIVTLLNQPDRRRQLAADGKQHVLTNFTWNSTITKLLKLYEEFQ